MRRIFAAEPRCYSRDTTAFLTDMAGLAVVIFLMGYFAVVGAMIYNDLVVKGMAW